MPATTVAGVPGLLAEGALPYRKRRALSEIMRIIDRDRLYYRKSKGGVTVSGGEPMVQYKFVKALLQQCKARGLHVCLDTCGYAEWEHYKEVLDYVDLVLYDLKHMDTVQSQRLTGVPNELILENARKMAEEGVALQIRIPIIPGCNDSEENIRATGAFAPVWAHLSVLCKSCPTTAWVPPNMKDCKEYQLAELKPPDQKQMKKCRGILNLTA